MIPPDYKPHVKYIYPIFNRCKKYTLDPFWTDLFEKCSRGSFPNYIQSFDPTTWKVTFIYRIGKPPKDKKKIVYKVPKKLNAINLYKTIKDGCHMIGVYSTNEIAEFNYPLFHYTKWNHIKSKAIREELISKYVDIKYPKDKNKFYEIMSFIQIKHITAADIKMKDGKIEDIFIKPLNDSSKKVITFPKYEQTKKTNLLSQAVLKFSIDRLKRL